MRTQLWTVLALHRFEIGAIGLGGLIGTIAALVIASRLSSLGVPQGCFGTDVQPSASCLDGLRAFSQIDRREAERFFAVLVIFPVLAGLLLGVPAVSREIERGTAAFPWTLEGSRRRWLLTRSVVLAASLLIALVPLALAADYLEGVRHPTVPAAASFGAEGLRGLPLVARGLAGFGAGLLIGLVIGRQLPALIVGFVAATVLVTGGLMIMNGWARSEGEARALDAVGDGDYQFDTMLRALDGTLVSFRDAEALQPVRPEIPPGSIDEEWIQANFEEVAILVPGLRYGEESLLHSGLLTTASLTCILLAFGLIERRRPS